MMIPVKYKEVKYWLKRGLTYGGAYTHAHLKIDENTLRFEHSKYKILKSLFNQLPVEFKKNKNEPEKIFINKFGYLRINYSKTPGEQCEITCKVEKEFMGQLIDQLEHWNLKIDNF